VERQFVTVELAERWIAVAGRAVLLGLTVGLGVATIICALRGYRWSIPTGVGGSSIVAGTLASIDRFRLR
jgi:hypothetical protein